MKGLPHRGWSSRAPGPQGQDWIEANSLRQRARLCDQLRDALRLVPKDPDRSRPPASELSPEDLADIESDLEALRSRLAERRANDSVPATLRQAIEIIHDHLDSHGDTLWVHLIELLEEQVGGIRFVQRTNDVLEDFFRTMKHGGRRRSGRKILTQDFEALPPAAALAVNLACPPLRSACLRLPRHAAYAPSP